MSTGYFPQMQNNAHPHQQQQQAFAPPMQGQFPAQQQQQGYYPQQQQGYNNQQQQGYAAPPQMHQQPNQQGFYQQPQQQQYQQGYPNQQFAQQQQQQQQQPMYNPQYQQQQYMNQPPQQQQRYQPQAAPAQQQQQPTKMQSLPQAPAAVNQPAAEESPAKGDTTARSDGSGSSRATGRKSYTHSPYAQPISPQSLALNQPQGSAFDDTNGSVYGGNTSLSNFGGNCSLGEHPQPSHNMALQNNTMMSPMEASGSTSHTSSYSHVRRSSFSSADSASVDGGNDGAANAAGTKVTLENIQLSAGRVTTIALSAHGSSFLQAALKQYPIEAYELIHKEVLPVLSKLILDKHACYVVKAVLEMMDRGEALQILQQLQTPSNDDLMLQLCTRDLHSRRMIQFMLDFQLGSNNATQQQGQQGQQNNCSYLFDLIMRRPMDIVRTQQGCITLQRILDHFPTAQKELYFQTVRLHFMEYLLDPFGNYIIQYMLSEGNQVENSNTLAACCRGQLHNMVCHKYASNVIEKCFGLVTPELQHDIIEEVFSAPDNMLNILLNDSSANYAVQAAIRAASFRDVTYINSRIAHLLPNVQYGKKLQQRLSRRLKQ